MGCQVRNSRLKSIDYVCGILGRRIKRLRKTIEPLAELRVALKEECDRLNQEDIALLINHSRTVYGFGV